jgi:hypothetical protein
MTRIPPPAEEAMGPELVAPGAVFLASAACDFSGAILRAAGGRFSVARYDLGVELDLGPEPVPPETIAARWNEIAAHAEP